MKGVIAMGYGYGLAILIVAALLCVFVAWIIGIDIITNAAKDKGYEDLNGKLTFIGFFGLFFMSAAIVAALPDKKMRSIMASNAQSNSATKDADDELPEL